MDRISLHEVSTFRWSFEEDVRQYRAAGYSSIGIWRQKISDYGEEKGAELLAEAGLPVSSLSWAGGFTGSDGRSFKESHEDARDALRVARLI
ncbi:MAG: sugar phosphate isomerase/epimerase, partial [Planctomycetota bacterium]